MAQNITLLGASYSAVPAVTLPKTGGGTAKFTDVTPTTATASDVASGKVFFDSTGVQQTGTSSGGGTGEWTTAGIAFNSEPSGAITLVPQNAGNVWVFAKTLAFCNKPITSVTFDFQNMNRQPRGAQRVFADSSLTSVSLINYNSYGWKPESTFNNAVNLLEFDTDCIIDFGGYTNAFSGCSRLKRLSVPNAVGQMFVPCQNDYLLEYADMGSAYQINANGFANCRVLQTLILRKSDSIVALANVSGFLNTPMRGYNGLTGKIYVPSALISSYQTATNWSTIYAQGYCEFVAIEGSEYEI